MKRIILASNSPRRKELLSEIGIPFDIEPSNIDEKINSNNNIEEEIKNISFKKALSVFNNHKEDIIISADTIVYVNNEVLGKPKDKNDIIRMMKLLRNKTHEVITAVTILSDESSETFSTITEVTFGNITDKEIEEYSNTTEPLDKAGAYAIQGIGKLYVKSIKGDYFSIMGLPIYELNQRLKKYYE